ncbi:unnamed protein product [Brachionus calyciflorus]|uniref:ZZ-type domain-containing protein n=1 Tax=Brachionus calyciflorus TaxID=104777 RepID=A0A813QBL5_9BILA|nr:unnamed protein product [Brachionus calyciflorus]
MNAVQVKCYFFPSSVGISINNLSQASEIRRFALVYSSNGLYEQLIEKIKTAYNGLIQSTDEIKTYWQDEENDLVCFSTDHEAMYAIDLQAALKISSNSMSTPIFKVYVSVKKQSAFEETPNEAPQIHQGIVCDGCEGSVKGTRYTCTVCPDFDLCSSCKNKGTHKEHDFITFTKPVRQRCPYGGRNRGFFRGMHRQGCRNQTHEQSSTNSTFNNPFSGLFPFISSAIPTVNNPEQLKNFGEHLKQFLDPFGIDVDYYVDSKDAKKDDKKSEEEKKSEEKKNEKDTSFENVDVKMETMDDLKLNESQTRASSSSTFMGSSSSASASAESFFEKVPSAPQNFKESIEMAANSLKEAFEKQSFAEFPKLSSLKTEEKLEENEDSGFNVVDIEKELKYIKCVDQLKAMGYTDEAGWLTRLVIAKDGNMNSVLDALQPSK